MGTSEVALIEAAAANSIIESEAVETLFRNDLKIELLPTLRKVRDLRTMLKCRVLWWRFEDLDTSFCDDLAPTMARGAVQLLSLAGAATIGILLKDNKILKYEMERFE